MRNIMGNQPQASHLQFAMNDGKEPRNNALRFFPPDSDDAA